MKGHSTFVALVSFAFGSFAWAQGAEPTDPASASSPHQQQTTQSHTDTAATGADTDPSASSTPHQREATRTAAREEASEEARVQECIDKLKTKDKGIPEYQAKKVCRDHVRKQASTSSGG
jgi:hypothetical protein